MPASQKASPSHVRGGKIYTPDLKPCKVPGCRHLPFSNTGGLSKHMKKVHPEVKV
jgi:hypothetical protein